MRDGDPRDWLLSGVHVRVQSAILSGLLVASALAPEPAYALRLLGVCVIGPCEERIDPEIIDPLSYEAELVVLPTNPGGEIDSAAESAARRASTLLARDGEPAPGASGLIALARGDYRRILAGLYNAGYYGPEIIIRINGQEVTTLPPDASLPDGTQVLIEVEPGPPFTFARADILNQAPPPTERRDEVEDPRDIGFETGEPALAGTIRRAGALAVDAWREQGHPKARIAERDVAALHPSDTLDAVLTVEPGPRAVYGPVTVTGTERMIPRFVARQTGLKPGEEYDPDDIERARERLSRLRVFRSIRLIEDAEVGPDGILPIEVAVDERELRRIGIGATVSNIDGLGAETFFVHRNLFGRAERLRLDASVGGIGRSGETDVEDFDYGIGASLLLPGRITPDTDITFDVRGDRQVLEPYTETSLDASVGLLHIFTPELTGRLALAGSRSRFEDDFGTRDFTTVGLLGGLTFDTRDDELDPTGGVYADAEVEAFREFEFENDAVRLAGEARAYYGFGRRDVVVIAGRAKIGSILGTEIDQTPPDRLFFAGGGGSVRGYAFQNIGLREDDGDVTGGLSLAEGSAEIRLRRVFRNFGAAAFVDVGTVADTASFEFDRLKIGVGAGVRYHTGLGPLRLDVAVPLDPEPGDPDVGIYVGLGQAF